MNQKIKITILCFSLPVLLYSQSNTSDNRTQPEDITNGAFAKEHNQQKDNAFVYPEISEKDIVWSRTIWREIDLRQKVNHHFYYPSEKESDLNPDYMSLIDVVFEALEENNQKVLEDFEYGKKQEKKDTRICEPCEGTGKITSGGQNTRDNEGDGEEITCSRCNGYKPELSFDGKKFTDDEREEQKTCVFQLRAFNAELQTPGREFSDGWMTPTTILTLRDEPDTKIIDEVQDEMTGQWVPKLKPNGIDTVFLIIDGDQFDRRLVTKWRIKEEWFFDKHRSKMSVRIIGLCPVFDEIVNGEETTTPLFWIYYPDFRDVLLNTKVKTITKNNAQERSYLGLFEKRMFGSRILQESNIMNRPLTDYMVGLDALLESERIKEEIFNIEQDMWEY